ncbi:MAG: hypothetical protein ACE5Q6_05920, partial [Dehalococcoidia bacterium]
MADLWGCGEVAWAGMSLSDNIEARSESIPASRWGGLLAALRYADFRVLWLSTLSNQLGTGMQHVLLGWLILEMTGSGGMVGRSAGIRAVTA